MYKTIKDNVSAEIVEKKSRFIANIYYVKSKEEAEDIIKDVKKKYFDARHNCFAYVICDGENKLQSRASDDGEPSGTAGAPILDILNKRGLVNVLVIVTRYFGGILLGTGGLVRAYSEATIKALDESQIIFEEDGLEIELILNYNDFEKFKVYCNKNSVNIINSIYGEKIKCIIQVNEEEKDKIINNLNELNFKIDFFNILGKKKIQKNIEKS